MDDRLLRGFEHEFAGRWSLELDSVARANRLFSSVRLNLAVVDVNLSDEAGFQLFDHLQGGTFGYRASLVRVALDEPI